ncbi:MAG: hypothetical protein WA775_09185 [Psychroserpens sp.]|uniref:hypothetical protein n=1 Tax=Psychroserpens sp. TaxID=2020870 RepID=UPI003C7133BB
MKITHHILTALFFCVALSVSAQQKMQKLSKTVEVAKDVAIDLNTSYVQIEIDTWNKNKVEIEAYVNGEQLSQEELQEALNDWNLKVEGSGNKMTISSEENSHRSWTNSHHNHVSLASFEALKALEGLGDWDFKNFPEIPELPEMPELPELPVMAKMEFPKVPQLPEMPELPEGIKNVSFDSEAYKKDGEAYLENWSKDFSLEDREAMKVWAREMGTIDFSSYENKMEVWGENFGETFGKRFGKDYEAKMQAWGEEFGKRFDGEWAKKMEAWGEKYGKEMEAREKAMKKLASHQEKSSEARLKVLENRMTERQKRLQKLEERLINDKAHRHNTSGSHDDHNDSHKHNSGHHDVIRTIKIKMPKKAKLNMNVRHGELKIASLIHNLKANIAHAALVANHIDGGDTSINVSYSPVDVTMWTNGELNLKYVDEAHLQSVGSLRLNSNSSNMFITDITGNAIIDGSFGDLSIANMTETFTNLNVILENSEAAIKLPTSNYSVYFKGNRSKLNNELTSQKTIENYPNGKSVMKTIILNAKYSDVVLKN